MDNYASHNNVFRHNIQNVRAQKHQIELKQLHHQVGKQKNIVFQINASTRIKTQTFIINS